MRKMRSPLSLLAAAPRRVAHRVISAGLATMQSNPARKARVVRLLDRFPTLKARLKSLARASARMPASALAESRFIEHGEDDATRLLHPASVRRCHRELMQARQQSETSADTGVDGDASFAARHAAQKNAST